MGECMPAPPNYVGQPGKTGGNKISCNAGSYTYDFTKNQDLRPCAAMCDKCKEGVKECSGFIKRDGKCHFMSDSPANDGTNVEFGSTTGVDGAMAYHRCPKHQWSDGSHAECQYPDDWKVVVSTGTSDACKCLGKDVEDKRFN